MSNLVSYNHEIGLLITQYCLRDINNMFIILKEININLNNLLFLDLKQCEEILKKLKSEELIDKLNL